MPVDLTSAVRFDLGRGTVKMGGAGQPSVGLEERAVLLPEDVLADLVAAAGPEVSAVAGRQLGASMGKRLADRLGGHLAVRDGSFEAVISALAAEVSVSGFGTVRMERWGRALVLVVEHAPRIDGGFVSAMLQGAIEAAVTNVTTTASEQQVRCTLLSVEERALRVLVANGRAVERVRAWLTEGVSWGEALTRLQATPSRRE
ncbi:MAG: hypothetical protein JWM74_1718 [Myxococcaceae bacterium]|nr:hypothetical protein [Myxococcaceae bacterium]